MKAFVNTHPQPGEQERYEGLRWTGTGGEDYATIALLPNPTHDGSLLILQGLQQEGSEAAGRFLADEESRSNCKPLWGWTPIRMARRFGLKRSSFLVRSRERPAPQAWWRCAAFTRVVLHRRPMRLVSSLFVSGLSAGSLFAQAVPTNEAVRQHFAAAQSAQQTRTTPPPNASTMQ